MEVQVVDRLTAPPPDVRNDAVARLGDSLLLRELGRDGEPLGDKRLWTLTRRWQRRGKTPVVIPNPADQNPWAQSRRPIDMMVQG